MGISLSIQVAEQIYSVMDVYELEAGNNDAEEVEKTDETKDISHFKLKFYADYHSEINATQNQSPFFYNNSWISQLFNNLPELPPEA